MRHTALPLLGSVGLLARFHSTLRTYSSVYVTLNGKLLVDVTEATVTTRAHGMSRPR